MAAEKPDKGPGPGGGAGQGGTKPGVGDDRLASSDTVMATGPARPGAAPKPAAPLASAATMMAPSGLNQKAPGGAGAPGGTGGGAVANAATMMALDSVSAFPSVAPRSATTGGSWSGSQAPAPFSGATAYAVDMPIIAPSADDGSDPLVGQRIDHFQIRSRLGEGGMGTVYLAHDMSLERPVALKVLRKELAGNAALVDRLIMEARAQARLQHPHVVTIYYIGSRDGAPYFAMEYVRGVSLEEHLDEVKQIPWAEALEYVIQTARALSAAQKRGIIHRDVKPSNLILAAAEHRGGSTREVMVADFGLAAPVGGRESSFAGSPHYASPEQIDGKDVDHRSDIYALGVSFHQLLTGKRPFEAETLTQLFVKHHDEPRPPIPEDKAPGRLRDLVTRMMDPDRNKRPASYDDLIDELERARPKLAASGGLVARGMALGVDLAVLAVFGQIVAGLSPLTQLVAHQFGMGLFGIYYVVAHKRWKRTLGKHFFGLRIQSTRGHLTWGRLLVRFLVEFWGPILAMLMVQFQLGATTDLESVKSQLTDKVGVQGLAIVDQSLGPILKTVLVPNLMLAIPWLGGFLFALFDDKRLALHDRAARTRVVYRHPERHGKA